MSHRIQSSNVAFDEIEFRRELVVGIFVLIITSFVTLRIIGFDPNLAKAGDIAISMQHSRFYIEITIWLKMRIEFDGWQWSLIQINEARFYFVSPWPFKSS
jgi:hypothetical protein